MAKKAKKGKAAPKPPSAAPRRPKSAVEKLLTKRAEQQREAWTKRNPAVAADERRIRKRNARVQEDFGHKRSSTPQTLAHNEAAKRRPGALARLHESGAITDLHLAAGISIALAYRRIISAVNVRTANLEPVIDPGIDGDALFWEKLGSVRLEMAYSAWRRALGPSANVAIAVIVHDMGIAAAAREGRMHVRKARRVLIEALELWRREWSYACRYVDEDAVLDAQAAVA